MESADITPEAVRQFIRAWNSGQRYTGPLAELDCLDRWEAREDRLQYLYNLLEAHVHAQLSYYRHLEDVNQHVTPPAISAELMAHIYADGCTHNSNLREWSALYYRHFEPDFRVDVHTLARAAGADKRSIHRRVRKGMKQLAGWLRREETRAHQAQHSALLRTRLGMPDYRQLQGSFALVEQVCNWLQDPAGPAFISIEGTGGIGKTAQAYAAVLRMTGHRDLVDIIWISARHEYLDSRGGRVMLDNPAATAADVLERLAYKVGGDSLAAYSGQARIEKLAQLLHHRFYLVVIDNLETLADVDALLPRLYPLAGQTRFLFTSRYSLSHHAFVHCLTVPELSPDASQQLLLDHMHSRSHLTAEEMHTIYETVGGVPLALKLIAPHTATAPVAAVLADLRRARAQAGDDPFEAMFRYLYQQTWRLLSDPARRLLLVIYNSVNSDGANWDWLRAMAATADLTEADLFAATADLHAKSLLEIRVMRGIYYYSLHRLTITFLQTQLMHTF
jgi:hypothetical protein